MLGAANSATRFWEARHLFNWVVGRAQGIVGGSDDRLRRPIRVATHSELAELNSRRNLGALAGRTPRLGVLMVASEVAPWAKTGGLADVLARAAGGARPRAVTA